MVLPHFGVAHADGQNIAHQRSALALAVEWGGASSDLLPLECDAAFPVVGVGHPDGFGYSHLRPPSGQAGPDEDCDIPEARRGRVHVRGPLWVEKRKGTMEYAL